MAGSYVKDTDKGYKDLKAKLQAMIGKEVLIGIQAGSATADGKGDLVQIAAAHEFGATIDLAERNQTLYRQVNKKGTGFNRKGRFVKMEQSNFASSHKVKATTITIPERSFLRSTFDEQLEKMNAAGQRKLKEVITGKLAPAAALDQLGQEFTGMVQKKIRAGPFTPNAPSTIKQKKSSRPLIDKGHMRQSVRHEVRNRGDRK